MRHHFDAFDPAAREAFAVLLATAQGDLYATHRADAAFVQALPVFDDLLDGPGAADESRDHVEEVFDQLRLHVLYQELERRWDMPRAELEKLWRCGLLRSRIEHSLTSAAAAG